MDNYIMFPFQQSDEVWPQISSNPYLEDHLDQEDLNLGQDSPLHGSDDLPNFMEKDQTQNILATSSNANDSGVNEKKISRKEIERQRRQQMSTLHASLRSLLPLESIKGKRSMSDHMNEAAKYIEQLKGNIQELSIKRDKLKTLSNSSTSLEQVTDQNSDNSLQDFVTVRPYFGGVEIVVSRRSEEDGFLVSRVLQALIEEGFDVVCCISTKNDERHYNTIQCQATDLTCIDVDGLQQKLTDVITSH